MKAIARIFALLLCFALVWSLPALGEGMNIEIDGKIVDIRDESGNPEEPVEKEGSIYVPLGFIGGALGKTAVWDGENSTVLIGSPPENPDVFSEQGDKITVFVDGKKLVCRDANGKAIEPFLQNAVVYVPIRAIAESCGMVVSWRDETKTVVIKSSKSSGKVKWGSLPIGGGGYVTGIIAGSNAIYARTDVGGAYRYDSGRWTQLLYGVSEENRGLLGVESIAVDPTNDSNVYIFAGTSYFSGGKTVIFRSSDGGKSFEETDVSHLVHAHGNGNGRQNGERLAVDPNTPNIIYCAGRTGGLIKSSDYGRTWELLGGLSEVLTKEVNWPSWTSNRVRTTENEVGIVSVVVDPQSGSPGSASRQIFAAVSEKGKPNVYVSKDGGKTWSTLSEKLPTNFYPQRLKFIPSGKLLIAYADTEGGNANGGAAFCFDIKSGEVWDISLPDAKPVGDIAFVRSNPEKLVATTRGQWQEQKWQSGKSCWGDVIYTSTNGGADWKRVLYTDENPITDGGIPWIDGRAIHWSGSIEINPQNENQIFVASGNGIFSCDNIWDEKPLMYFNSKGLEETVPLDLISVPGGAVYSAVGDYDGFIHTSLTDYAHSFKPEIGSAGSISYAPSKPEVMMRIGTDVSQAKACYSLDSGLSWIELENPDKMGGGTGTITMLSDGRVRFIWSPKNKENTYYSDDYGRSWNICSGLISNLYLLTDTVAENFIYASGENALYVSEDYGATFTKRDINNGGLKRISLAKGIAGKIFAPCSGGGLMVSEDFGKTFRKLPNIEACSAVGVGKEKEKDAPLTIYVWAKANGSEKYGMYRSVDDGRSWERINDDEHEFGGPGNGNFIVGDINTYGIVYMSTVGLGIIYREER